MSDRSTIVKGANKFGTPINFATEETLQSIAGMVGSVYDYLVVTYPNTTTEVYTFKTGGSGGTTVSVVTIVYTDTTKEFISTVTKS